MSQKFLITKELLNGAEYRIAALFEDRRMLEAAVQLSDGGNGSILNNIYVGRVRNVAANLNAAFVETADGTLCYLSFEDIRHPVFTKKPSKKLIAAGDELLVQVCKEAVRTKYAVVTTNLSFSGEYIVLTSANRRIGVSSKVSRAAHERLAAFAQDLRREDTDYGIIVRTNAASASDETIAEEFSKLKNTYENVLAAAPTRSAGSCLYQERPFYFKMLQDVKKETLEEVVTDDAEIYAQLSACGLPQSCGIRLYEDALLPLPRLFNIGRQIENALRERVWLKSGANIIIQPTEALTVIDVNSGKNIAKKEKQLNHYRINLEAAEEIARQLRLRNLSGIIIIDFIDLDDEDFNQSLLKEFRAFLKKDPVPVQLVDMTRLGLVELTRKKQRKSLAEQIRMNGETGVG